MIRAVMMLIVLASCAGYTSVQNGRETTCAALAADLGVASPASVSGPCEVRTMPREHQLRSDGAVYGGHVWMDKCTVVLELAPTGPEWRTTALHELEHVRQFERGDTSLAPKRGARKLRGKCFALGYDLDDEIAAIESSGEAYGVEADRLANGRYPQAPRASCNVAEHEIVRDLGPQRAADVTGMSLVVGGTRYCPGGAR